MPRRGRARLPLHYTQRARHLSLSHHHMAGGAGECDREGGPSAFSSGYPCLACQKHINCSESDGFSQQVVSSFEFGVRTDGVAS